MGNKKGSLGTNTARILFRLDTNILAYDLCEVKGVYLKLDYLPLSEH